MHVTNSDQTWKINNAEYKKKDKEVKKSYKNHQRKWVEDKGREAEEAAARSDSKTLYRIVRDLTGSRNITNVTIKSRNGEVLLTEREQSSRWVEHFNEVLNQDSPTDMFDFRDECDLGMIDASLEDIDISETIKALRKLKNNKATGLDEITAELLKHGKKRVAQELIHLFNLLWHAEDVPEECRQGIIIPLPKKGCLSDCNNWRA